MNVPRANGHDRHAPQPWRKVVFADDCDEDGNCPVCGIDYGDCDCPGPTMDEMEYCEIDGVLYARPFE